MTIVEKIKWRIDHARSIEERMLDLRFSKFFKGKRGIEIGGPTPLFNSQLPIYKMVKSLDGCNFSSSTVWEGNISEGENYNYYQDKKGHQFIFEASDLKGIEKGSYDFLLASHCLEHCANTLQTINEWLRVLKPGGYMLLVLPDKRFTFDHKRKVTPFDHLLSDFERKMDEKDLTHLEEVIALHDLSMDSPAGDINNFRERCLNNFENRCLHHHVFDFDLLLSICKFFKLSVKFKKWIAPYHQIIIVRKRKAYRKDLSTK